MYELVKFIIIMSLLFMFGVFVIVCESVIMFNIEDQTTADIARLASGFIGGFSCHFIYRAIYPIKKQKDSS